MLKMALLTLLYFMANLFVDNAVAAPVDLSVVATEHHLLQYQEEGEHKGPTIEILQAILKASQLTAKVTFMPWARAFSTALHNENTLILSMIRTPEREHKFHWLIKVSQAARVFISLKSKPENAVSTLAQAKTKLVAVIRGTSAHKELQAKGFSEENNLYVVSNDQQMLTLFVNGRVDLLYTDPNVVLDYLAQQNKQQQVALHFEEINGENQRHSYIAANINTDKKLLARLKTAIAKFQKTTNYQTLLLK